MFRSLKFNELKFNNAFGTLLRTHQNCRNYRILVQFPFNKICTGSVNPFCQLELDNQFARTRTLTNVKTPVWEKTFKFRVRDAFSLLKITIASEKIDSPQIILGKTVIRLSQLVKHEDQDLWIPLKDKTLR